MASSFEKLADKAGDAIKRIGDALGGWIERKTAEDLPAIPPGLVPPTKGPDETDLSYLKRMEGRYKELRSTYAAELTQKKNDLSTILKTEQQREIRENQSARGIPGIQKEIELVRKLRDQFNPGLFPGDPNADQEWYDYDKRLSNLQRELNSNVGNFSDLNARVDKSRQIQLRLDIKELEQKIRDIDEQLGRINYWKGIATKK